MATDGQHQLADHHRAVPNAQKAASLPTPTSGMGRVEQALDLDKVDEAVRLVKLQLVSYKTAQQKRTLPTSTLRRT